MSDNEDNRKHDDLIKIWGGDFYKREDVKTVTVKEVSFEVGTVSDLKVRHKTMKVFFILLAGIPWFIFLLFTIISILQLTTSFDLIAINYVPFFVSWIIFSVISSWLYAKMFFPSTPYSYSQNNKKVVVTLKNGDTVGKDFESKLAYQTSEELMGKIKNY